MKFVLGGERVRESSASTERAITDCASPKRISSTETRERGIVLFTFRKARQKTIAGVCCNVTRNVLDVAMYEREVMFGGTENRSKEVGENEGNAVGVLVLVVTLTEGDTEGT